METEEVRAEIKRRKKRAGDLKLRELLWNLHHYHLSRYPALLKKDPAMILPELKDTLEVERNKACFRIGETRYKLSYKGKAETDSCGSRSRSDEITTINLTFSLCVDDSPVFTFEVMRMEQFTPEAPYFSEHMGEVLGFIEGPWVNEIGDLARKMNQHEHAVQEKRDAPRQAQKLREDMKRFGL
jgi:hypothetical protein